MPQPWMLSYAGGLGGDSGWRVVVLSGCAGRAVLPGCAGRDVGGAFVVL